MILWPTALDGPCGPKPVCKLNMQVIGYSLFGYAQPPAGHGWFPEELLVLAFALLSNNVIVVLLYVCC